MYAIYVCCLFLKYPGYPRTIELQLFQELTRLLSKCYITVLYAYMEDTREWNMDL